MSFCRRFGSVLGIILASILASIFDNVLVSILASILEKFERARRDARGWAKGFEQDLGFHLTRYVPTPAEWAADLIASRIPPGRAKGIDETMG